MQTLRAEDGKREGQKGSERAVWVFLKHSGFYLAVWVTKFCMTLLLVPVLAFILVLSGFALLVEMILKSFTRPKRYL